MSEITEWQWLELMLMTMLLLSAAAEAAICESCGTLLHKWTAKLQNENKRQKKKKNEKVRIGKQKSSLIVQVCLVMLDSKREREQCQVESSPLRRRRAKRRPHRDTIDRCSSLSVCVCVHYCITDDHTAIESDHTSKLLPRQSGCFVVVWSGSLADCLRLCPSQWVLLCEWVCVCLALSSFSSTDSIDGRQLPLD